MSVNKDILGLVISPSNLCKNATSSLKPQTIGDYSKISQDLANSEKTEIQVIYFKMQPL
jgi:ABC-type histidine transport system ATPase subunit